MDTMIYSVFGIVILCSVLCEAIRPVPQKSPVGNQSAHWSPVLLWTGGVIVILLIGFAFVITSESGVRGICHCGKCQAQRRAGTGGLPIAQRTSRTHWADYNPRSLLIMPVNARWCKLPEPPANNTLPGPIDHGDLANDADDDPMDVVDYERIDENMLPFVLGFQYEPGEFGPSYKLQNA